MPSKTQTLKVVREDSIPGGNTVVTVLCPICDSKILIEDDDAREFYRIESDGWVFPEVVCMNTSCRFSNRIRLQR